MSCPSSDHDKKKTPGKFQKDPGKTVGGVGYSRYTVSICINPKISKFKLVKSDKN